MPRRTQAAAQSEAGEPAAPAVWDDFAASLATGAELFDTRFRLPETSAVACGRVEVNAARFWANYLGLLLLCLFLFGLGPGCYICVPLVLAHATLKTRSLRSKVKTFFRGLQKEM